MLGLMIQSDLGALARNLDRVKVGLGKQVLSRSVNKVAGKAKTAEKREVTKAGGFKSRYVGDNLKLSRASAKGNAYEATITARGEYSTLTRFTRQQFISGGAFTRAKPWNTTRKYHQAFWIKGKNGAAIPVVRTGRGRSEYKTLYGPSVGREAGRPESLDPVLDLIRRELPVEAKRYADVQMGKYLQGRQGQLR
jgi:hypothetical protein